VAYIIKSKNLNIHKIKSGANVIELVESWLYKHVISNFSSVLPDSLIKNIEKLLV
jgi:hypothetical protein